MATCEAFPDEEKRTLVRCSSAVDEKAHETHRGRASARRIGSKRDGRDGDTLQREFRNHSHLHDGA